MATFTVSPSSLSSLKSKTVLITGGSSGLGLATARLISSLSPTNNIAILDRAPPPSHLSISESRFLFYQCDITSWTQQRAGFAAAAAKFGRIDAVFVNAGIAEYKDQFFIDELDSDKELKEPDRRTLNIDMDAASDTTKLAIHWLRKNREGGSIIMTASLAGYLATGGAPLYSAAKHGIVGLMRSLKQETAKLNIAVSVIAPGITTTPIIVEDGSNQSPEEYAAAIQKLGVPINKAETVALCVAWLINSGLEANGKGILIQSNRMVDVEKGLAMSRKDWMGREMLDLFRSGRDALLPQTIEKGKL